MQERYESYRDATVEHKTLENGLAEGLDEHLSETLDTENLPDFSDVVHALGQLHEVLPADHPDIVNLRQAMHFMLDHPETLPQLEDFGVFGESKLGQGDPYENDPIEEAEQVFDQQMQSVEQMFEVPGFMSMNDQIPDTFEQQQSQLEMMMEEFQQDDPFQQQGLEEIVEHADIFNALEQQLEPEMMPGESMLDMPHALPELDGSALAYDEIHQAINQLSEPGPSQLQYGPAMEEQYMFDPLQQPIHPYMVLGPMPFGPMGPMASPGM